MEKVMIQTLRFDSNGLIPAIVQDADTNRVLMMAYLNRESLQLTLAKRETYFWSRT
jgi:phosphoribosyl-AMP cyclohydrolase